jgi:copper chaperone
MPTIKRKGMHCGHCVASVTEVLRKIDGVTDVQVTLDSGEAHYTESKPVSLDVIKAAISKIGFETI